MFPIHTSSKPRIHTVNKPVPPLWPVGSQKQIECRLCLRFMKCRIPTVVISKHSAAQTTLNIHLWPQPVNYHQTFTFLASHFSFLPPLSLYNPRLKIISPFNISPPCSHAEFPKGHCIFSITMINIKKRLIRMSKFELQTNHDMTRSIKKKLESYGWKSYCLFLFDIWSNTRNW